MTEPDLTFISRQLERVLADIADLTSMIVRLNVRMERLDETMFAQLAEMRRMREAMSD